MIQEITLLCATWPPDRCGVGDYSRQLALALARSVRVTVVTRPGEAEPVEGVTLVGALRDGDPLSALPAIRAAGGPVLLQYSPFLYAPKGIDPWVPWLVARLKGGGRETLVVFHEIHEPYRLGPVAWVRGRVQRVVASALFALSRAVVVTSQERLAVFARESALFPGKLRLVPVGSNVEPSEPAGAGREEWRRGRGLSSGEFALLIMGLDHPSKQLDHLALVLRRLQEAGVRLRFMAAGTIGPALRAGGWPEDLPLEDLGYLGPGDLGLALAGADGVVLPYVDGASTRRSSLITALACGARVVTTRGYNTSPELEALGAYLSAPSGDGAALASELISLARDPRRGAELGRRAREVHQERFAWDLIAREILDALPAP